MIRLYKILFVLLFLTGCEKDPPVPAANRPEVSTKTPVSAITVNTANTGGAVTSHGGAVILSRGVCWSTNINPTINANKTEVQGGMGLFTSELTGLTPGTTYYIRAYATNRAGTGYGNQVAFTTLAMPVVLTSSIRSITVSSAVGGGSISSNGGSAITVKGICWSKSMNPTIALGTKTSNGSGNGSFSASITGLASKTTYYIRAWATNAVGTSYGSNISFRTN